MAKKNRKEKQKQRRQQNAEKSAAERKNLKKAQKRLPSSKLQFEIIKQRGKIVKNVCQCLSIFFLLLIVVIIFYAPQEKVDAIIKAISSLGIIKILSAILLFIILLFLQLKNLGSDDDSGIDV